MEPILYDPLLPVYPVIFTAKRRQKLKGGKSQFSASGGITLRTHLVCSGREFHLCSWTNGEIASILLLLSSFGFICVLASICFLKSEQKKIPHILLQFSGYINFHQIKHVSIGTNQVCLFPVSVCTCYLRWSTRSTRKEANYSVNGTETNYT